MNNVDKHPVHDSATFLFISVSRGNSFSRLLPLFFAPFQLFYFPATPISGYDTLDTERRGAIVVAPSPGRYGCLLAEMSDSVCVYVCVCVCRSVEGEKLISDHETTRRLANLSRYLEGGSVNRDSFETSCSAKRAGVHCFMVSFSVFLNTR